MSKKQYVSTGTLKPADVVEIFELSSEGNHYGEIGSLYNLSAASIARILDRQSRQEVAIPGHLLRTGGSRRVKALFGNQSAKEATVNGAGDTTSESKKEKLLADFTRSVRENWVVRVTYLKLHQKMKEAGYSEAFIIELQNSLKKEVMGEVTG